jgi:hypothetical protein
MKSSAAHLRVNGNRVNINNIYWRFLFSTLYNGERGNIKILREYEKPDIDTEIERPLSPYIFVYHGDDSV